ncbi:MAG: helix-turn-helix domain-containing protein [Actinobacteria bacterium]|nr:helix-turn-helix domain-containing protein [Actinomycetota bacterium]
MEKLLDGKTMSNQLSIGYHWLMRKAEQGLIPSIKVGRCRRFDPEEVLAWLKSGKMEKALEAFMKNGRRGNNGQED